MITFKQFLTELHLGKAKSITGKFSFDVFADPTPNEIKGLKADYNIAKVRFTIHNNRLYVFPIQLLHTNAMDFLNTKLNLNVNYKAAEADITLAFMGIAKILPNGKLRFEESNQFTNNETAKLQAAIAAHESVIRSHFG